MRKLLLLVAVMALVLPEAVQSVTNNSSTSYTTSGISLEMFDPAGSVYQQGESVRFAVRSDQDAYVVVFNIDTDGYVNLLYPRNSRSIQSFVGGVSYSIPTDVDMDLLVSGKTGIEFVFAVSIKDRNAINTDQLASLLQDETRPPGQRYRVTGDPFLAANRIVSRIIDGIAYTKDESIAYTYFYVNAAVDFPRYLCLDCEAQGKDPYSSDIEWAATSAFDSADRLSYPLEQAFVRSDMNVALENPGLGGSSESPTVIHVHNTYYNDRYPYYPGYYRPYWGSSFYFSVGWNWGWGAGWGWGYPHYYPYWGYAYGYPRPIHYYPGYGYGGWRHHGRGYGHALAYRPTLRPRSGVRYKGGTSSTYRSRTDTASRLRSKSMRYERTDKLRTGATGGTKLAGVGGGKSRPVYKVTSRPAIRTGNSKYSAKGIRPTTGSRHKTGKGYTMTRGTRPVRTIKGQPTRRKTIDSRQRAVRGTGKSTTRPRGTLPRVKSGSGASRGWSAYKRPTRGTGSSRVKARSGPTRGRSYSTPTRGSSSKGTRSYSKPTRGSSSKSTRSYSKPTTRRSAGSSRSAVRRSAPRSGSRSGSAARSSRAKSSGGGRRK